MGGIARQEDYRAVTADGVEIALHRLLPARPREQPPVLLVPGTFSTRTFWIGNTGQGFARQLASSGFDTWVVELRGHGRSDRPRVWLLTDWIEQDAPAAVERVLERSGAETFHWIGHSAGGVVGAAFSGTAHPVAGRMGGLVLLGSPGPGGLAGIRRWLARGIHRSARALPRLRLPGEWVGLGPETEPMALIAEWIGWNLSGRWTTSGGEDYLTRLRQVPVPVLAVAGAGDRLLAPPHAVRDLLERFGSPERRLIVAGVETGYARNFDHAGLVIGSAARAEIWPRVIAWLEEHGTASGDGPEFRVPPERF